MRLQPNHEFYSAQYNAAQITRGAVARLAGYHFTMNLAPLATDMAEGDDKLVRMSMEDERFRMMQSPDATVETNFRRTWHGDDARLMVLMGVLMEPALQKTFRELPGNLRQGLVDTYKWSQQAALELAEHRQLDIDEDKNHYEIADDSERGRWTERLLRAVAVNALKYSRGSLPNLELGRSQVFLEQLRETTVEHTAAWLLDVLHGFTPYENATSEDMFRAVVAHSYGVSALSFMPNQHNAEAEYRDRYVRADSPEEGMYGVRREPLVVVETNGVGGYTIIPHHKDYRGQAVRGKRNRCPGSDGLKPTEKDKETNAAMRDALKSVIAGCYGEDEGHYSKALDRDFAMTDITPIIGAAAARGLVEYGAATFSTPDMQRHLIFEDEVVSTGAYILKERNITMR